MRLEQYEGADGAASAGCPSACPSACPSTGSRWAASKDGKKLAQLALVALVERSAHERHLWARALAAAHTLAWTEAPSQASSRLGPRQTGRGGQRRQRRRHSELSGRHGV